MVNIFLKRLYYKDIIEYLNSRNQNYILLSDEKDYQNRILEQNTTTLYVKLLFQCTRCGELIERNLACCKISKHLGLCRKCGLIVSAEPQRANYQEKIDLLIEKGFTPLFTANEVQGMLSKVECIGSCGHKIITTLDSFCRSKTALCLDCSRHSHNGENNYNWKGGYENERIKFRKTFEFKNFVRQVLKRDNYSCKICGKNSKETKLVVHHKDGYNWCEEKRTEIENGVTLCEECHINFHNLYGYGNNTKDQFEDFCKNIKN